MFGLGGLNPKKMNAVMSQMGIKQEEIDAEEVIIKGKDKKIIIRNPSVSKINFSGQEMFQISGNVSEEEAKEEISEEDIKTVMNRTGKSKKEVMKVLEKNNGDLASSIIELKE